jgi:hypothetical protein
MLFMTTAGAEMLTKKFGVKMDSHLSKEQLAIARAFRSVQTDMRRNNRMLVHFLSNVPVSGHKREKWPKKHIFGRSGCLFWNAKEGLT